MALTRKKVCLKPKTKSSIVPKFKARNIFE